VDPFDIKYLGLYWRGAYFVDTAVPFRYRHGTQASVRIADTIRFILSRIGIFVFNYINNIIGIAPDDDADIHFKNTFNLLKNLGFLTIGLSTISFTNLH
jgi:hypothetical protein